ncbi:MAG: hypothetical protein FWF51_06915 [Chitinivibrionia bacterium]|nr:hypothetical protein [Chitinivibrionia bacterium]
MKLNFLFLTKLLVSVFLVCGVMFFAGCGDDDDEKSTAEKIDGGKTGEIAGVYKSPYGIMLYITGSNSGTGYYTGGELGNERENFTWWKTITGIVIETKPDNHQMSLSFDGQDTISGGANYNTYVRVK